MEQGGIVYIMTNYKKTTLYVGVTSDLYHRVIQHKTADDPKSFTAKYHLKYCVYYEMQPSIEEAIYREKEIKKWRRAKKDALINGLNPKWKDLWQEIRLW